MTRGIPFLLVAFAVLARAQVPGLGLPIETKVWVATKLYASVQMYYAHAEGAPGFDADREYQTFLKAAFAPGGDRRTFDLAAKAFMGKLRNGHSGFYDSWLNKNYGQSIGFGLLPMPEGWVVSFSRIADLNPGDIVESIDGRPFDGFFYENDVMIEGSSERKRRQKFSSYEYLWPERFELGLAGGRRVTVDRKALAAGKERGFPFPQGDVTTPEGIGYIRIQSFEDPAKEQASIRRVGELNEAQAIIFDVRGNGGGSTPSHLIDALLGRPYRDFRFTTPVHIAYVGAQHQVRQVFPRIDDDPYDKGSLDAFEELNDADLMKPGPLHLPVAGAYTGKVVLLVDSGCASACEDFVEPFKVTGRGVIVGEATTGSSGQPYYFDFGNGMSFRVSSKRYYMPDGRPFEGVGIKPDVEVAMSLDDYKAGRDVALARAVQLAAGK